MATYNILINALILLSKNNFNITLGSIIVLNILYYIFAYLFLERFVVFQLNVLGHGQIVRCKDHDLFP